MPVTLKERLDLARAATSKRLDAALAAGQWATAVAVCNGLPPDHRSGPSIQCSTFLLARATAPFANDVEDRSPQGAALARSASEAYVRWVSLDVRERHSGFIEAVTAALEAKPIIVSHVVERVITAKTRPVDVWRALGSKASATLTARAEAMLAAGKIADGLVHARRGAEFARALADSAAEEVFQGVIEKHKVTIQIDVPTALASCTLTGGAVASTVTFDRLEKGKETVTLWPGEYELAAIPAPDGAPGAVPFAVSFTVEPETKAVELFAPGTLLWQAPLPGGRVPEGPAVAKDRLLCPVSGGFVAYDKRTGKRTGAADIDIKSTDVIALADCNPCSPPLCVGDLAYLAFDNGCIGCIHVGDGRCLWRFPLEARLPENPLVGFHEQTLLVVSETHAFCFDRLNGTRLWDARLTGMVTIHGGAIGAGFLWIPTTAGLEKVSIEGPQHTAAVVTLDGGNGGGETGEARSNATVLGEDCLCIGEKCGLLRVSAEGVDPVTTLSRAVSTGRLFPVHSSVAPARVCVLEEKVVRTLVETAEGLHEGASFPPQGNAAPFTAIGIASARIVVADARGTIQALDLEGRVLAAFEAGSPVNDPVAIGGDVVYFTTLGGTCGAIRVAWEARPR